MRKSLLILLQTIMFAMPLFAERVDEKTAQKVAETFLKSKMQDKTDLKLAPIAYTNRADFSNLYVFGGENYFVIVSADDCVKPILGYSDENPFGTDAMPENVYGWLKDYDNQIQLAIENHVKASSDVRSRWQNLKAGIVPQEKSTNSISPLLQTKWNQNNPYNVLCPKVGSQTTYTGCVATAMAQVMKYWEYPAHGMGIHSYTWNNQTLSVDFGVTTYDWENMEDVYNYYYYDGEHYTYNVTTTPEQNAAVATLMYHCGVSVDMDYGTDGSGAVTAYVADALKTYFNYKPTANFKNRTRYAKDAWIAMLLEDLSADRPVQYSGSDAGGGGGHSFVCDGYDTEDRFHFNWGWAGHYDGYYSIDVMEPGIGGIGAGQGVYTANQGAIFGVEPFRSDASEPTNLTATLQNLKNVRLDWTAGTNAVAYTVYRDGNEIASNVTSVTYTDVNVPFGTHRYCIKSVDGNNEMSLASYPVTIILENPMPIVTDLSGTFADNQVALSWTEPDWCYPSIHSAIVTYGDGDVRYSWTSVYYGHRYMASNLSQHANKVVYKIGTYIQYPGTYSVYVYNKTKNSQPDPSALAASKEDLDISVFNTWYDIDLDTPVTLTGTDDLWVVMKQSNTGQQYPTPSFDLAAHNTNACYAGSSSTNLRDVNSSYNISWFIKAYVTDGTYTYNLYRDDVKIADALTETSYIDGQMANDAVNIYTVKTNYYGGETQPSNKVGFAKGSVTVQDLSLAEFDKVTVSQNACLTVNGNLVNQNADNLIIEDNAQLIHSNSGVLATVKKNISGFGTGNGNWYLVASPMVENVAVTPFATGEYDLYRYNEPTHYWWNSKTPTPCEGEGGEDHHFDDLANGTGYLYGNGVDFELSLPGELQPSNESVDVTLSYTSSLNALIGFNLIGNPFPCQASVSGDIAPDFYVMNVYGDELEISTDNTVNPFEGIFVQATGENAIATFHRHVAAKGEAVPSCFDITVSEGRHNIDRARVRFGEGCGLNKFSLNENSAKIYIPVEKQDYASVYVSHRNMLPLNFKPAKNGTYTLNFDLNNMDLDYLHLIDNLTGADIDLMAAAASTSSTSTTGSASYSFEAKMTDYPSRFKLMFAKNQQLDEAIDSDFLYYADGQLFVFSADGKGTLEIIDATGRIVMVENVNGYFCKSMSLKSGVYVTLLISDKTMKTQKFVVK